MEIEAFVLPLCLAALVVVAVYWVPLFKSRRWGLRLSQLLDHQESLCEEGGLDVFAPTQVASIDFRGSVLGMIGAERECRGWFELSENGVHGVATDCKFRFKCHRRSPVWSQTVLEIRFPGAELPFWVAHPRPYAWLAAYEIVRIGAPVDLTHQFECLYPAQIQSLFAGFAQEELALLSTRQWSVECDRDRILIYQLRRLIPPGEIKHFIREGIQFANAIHGLATIGRPVQLKKGSFN